MGEVCVRDVFFFFSSRRRHTRFDCDWSSDVCSSDLLLGITGAGARGAPLANLMVERLREAGVLQKGAAYWLGRALKAAPGKDPLHAIERVAAHPERLPPLSEAEEAQLRDEMRGEARSAVREVQSRIDQRRELKKSLKVGSFEGAPWKY